MICRQQAGNSKSFPCFYHHWTFNSEGELRGVPDREGYGEKLDFASLGLKSPRMEIYRGFVFVSFDPDIVDLVTYLAGAREYLDLIVDSGDGEMEIVRGTNEYCISANWKLLCENSIDGYHAAAVHDTYFKYLINLGTRPPGRGRRARRTTWATGTRCWSTPRRGAVRSPSGSRSSARTRRDEIAALRADLVTKHGEERAHRMAETNRNMLIYPNLVVNDIMAVTVRTFMPLAPDRHGRHRLGTGSAWGTAAAAAATTGQLPDLPRPGRIRHPGRRRGTGVLPAGLHFRRRGVE